MTHYSLFDPLAWRLLSQQPGLLGYGKYFSMVAKIARRTISVREGLVEVDKELMFLLFGECARVLADKSVFPHIVRSMGYQSPDTMVVSVDSTREECARSVQTYFIGKEVSKLFCKPLHGTWQRGLKIINADQKEIDAYLAQISEDTVVQEYIPHETTLRYTRYQDAHGKVFAACFEFIDRNQPGGRKVRIPVFGRILAFPKMGVSLDGFIETELNLFALPLSNRVQQHDNLNRFMDRFTEELEEEIGGRLPLLSVDIGIKNMHYLEGGYNEERMRDNMVFFETQTIPHPWRVRGEGYLRMLYRYSRLWRLFFSEHGIAIKQRIC